MRGIPYASHSHTALRGKGIGTKKHPAVARQAVPDYPRMKKSRSESLARGGILDEAHVRSFTVGRCIVLQG